MDSFFFQNTIRFCFFFSLVLCDHQSGIHSPASQKKVPFYKTLYSEGQLWNLCPSTGRRVSFQKKKNEFFLSERKSHLFIENLVEYKWVLPLNKTVSPFRFSRNFVSQKKKKKNMRIWYFDFLKKQDTIKKIITLNKN